MTVAAGSVVLGPFIPNGVVTDWPFTFTAFADSEVVPRLVTPTGSSIPTHITTRANVEDIDAPGGVVVIDPPLETGSGQLFISYFPDMGQETAFEDQARFSPRTMNHALDLAASRTQYVNARVDRAQKVPLGETGPAIRSAASRAGLFRVWTDNGLDERTDITASQWFNFGASIAFLLAAVAALQAQVAALFSMISKLALGGLTSGGLDLTKYINTADQVADIGGDPATWTDVSAGLRQAFSDAAAFGLQVDASRLRGLYFIDPASPILVRRGSGYIGPDVAPAQLSYVVTAVDGGGNPTAIKDYIAPGGLVFVVNVKSANNQVPKLALQGSTTVRGLQIAGVGLLSDAAGINVTNYTSTGIVGAPTDHAPVICTDHRHDANGNLVAQAKAGNVTLDCHLVGLMQGVYIGDPLVSEEPWAVNTASGNQTGISFTDITITGSPMKRVLGVARSTAGGLKANIQAIPPYWTGISQPKSGGITNYSLLKWFQKNGRVVDGWHRWVGFDITIQARGFRYGVYLQAGYNALGPANQDTGKYNAGTIRLGCERVITAVHVEPNAYMHRVNLVLNGHYMDEYNLKGETGALLEVLSDGAIAGSIDKTVYDAWSNGHIYSINDKVPSGSGDVFSCTVGGTATVQPTASGPNYNSSTKLFTDPGAGGPVWIFRNGGFKPFGGSLPFARWYASGVVNETAGPALLNTANDAHVFVGLDGLSVAQWSQANGHHGEAMIRNLSPITVISHCNAQTYGNARTLRVYDVADESRLRVGGMNYFGPYVMPADGSDPPEIGGNLSADFFVGKNCYVFNYGSSGNDDDDGEED